MSAIFHTVNANLPRDAFGVLKSRIAAKAKERGCRVARKTDGALTLRFCVDRRLAPDSFEIAEKKTGSGSIVRLAGSDIPCVFAAAGRFLVLSRFDGKGGFTPPELPLRHRMKKPVRGIYLASHFYNWHHSSPIEEELEYIADQALRGFNQIMLCVGIQHYRTLRDPEALEMIGRIKRIFAFTSSIGMKNALIAFSNTGMDGFPREFAAEEKADGVFYTRDITAEFITELCPSTEGGMREIERIQREFFSSFAGTPVDYYYLWPYDEGGCLCEKCRPWSTNGFMKVAALDRRLMKEYGIGGELCISTWHFGVQMPGEWENFYPRLESGEYSWAPYIMTAFQSGRLPSVIAEKGIPHGVRFVEFPEISMQNPAHPWGGFGATPFPMYLNNVEENTGAYNEGGFLYSEGIYEDINKYIVAGFWCGYAEHDVQSMREYFGFEFGIYDDAAAAELVRACQLMESCHRRETSHPDDGTPWRFQIRWATAAPEIKKIVVAADPLLPAKLRRSWKWRLFIIRAHLDFILYSNGYRLKDSPEAQELLAELCRISCVTERTKYCVCPPLGK